MAVLIAGAGVVAWVVHAVRCCTGRRATFWQLAWLLGLPLLCLLDYLAFLVAFRPIDSGISAVTPVRDQFVVNLFVGLALWVALLLLEPLLLLADALVRRRRGGTAPGTGAVPPLGP